MRVSGGTGRGRKLRTPGGLRVRPTSDKVKQALFNILGGRSEGAVFLDLFAGAGGIGIEALSRGASQAVFVDASKDSIRLVRENLAMTGFEARAQVVQADAAAFLRTGGGAFDIVFLDPPYTEDIPPLLEAVAAAGILKPDAIVVAEHFKKQPSPEKAGALALYREARYGDTVLSFYKTSNGEGDEVRIGDRQRI